MGSQNINIWFIYFTIGLYFKITNGISDVNGIEQWISMMCKNRPIFDLTLVLDEDNINDQSQSNLLNDIIYIGLQQDKFVSRILLSDEESVQLTKGWINHFIIVFDSPRSWNFIANLHSASLIANHVLILVNVMETQNRSLAYMSLKNVRHDSKLYMYLPNQGTQLLHDRRSDLKGVTLRVGFANIPAFNYENKSGIWYDIFMSYKADLNFEVEFKKSPDNLFGSKVGENEFSGMLGMIQRNEIDFSPEGFSITETRQEVAEFSFPIQETYAKLYVNVYNRIKLNWESFLKVFEWKFRVWILGFLVIFIILLHFIFKVRDVARNKPLKFVEHGLVIYFGILGLSYNKKSEYFSFKILMMTVMMFGALLAWAFNATLVSILSSTGKQVPIKRMEDILRYKDFQLIVKKGTSIEDDFRQSSVDSNPIFYKIYKEVVEGSEDKVFLPSKVTVEKLSSNEKFVMLNEEFSFLTNFKDISCVIKEDSQKYSFVHHAWAFNPAFEYKELFNHHILRMRQFGIMTRFYREMKKGFHLQRCTEYDDSAYSDIDFENIILIFILISVGIALSLMVLMSEYILHRFSNVKLKNICETMFIG
ncbi:glutamate receptor ionotropic, kainate glr-3-like isoform X2 [Lepeophtheirus salmonis]|uniref:glutamate receptor ionotropic, kainate glr-3-like isoform X2 n=1 Tax=Lepeophtheirus salmonis TaxID=72036 RepID=UPI003AF3E45F